MRKWRLRKIVAISIVCMIAIAVGAQAKTEFVRDTGSSAIDMSVGASFGKITSVRIHLSSAATQDTLTIAVDSESGSAYDVELISQAMAAVQDYVLDFEQPFALDEGDLLTIAFPNNDGLTYGVEVTYDY